MHVPENFSSTPLSGFTSKPPIVKRGLTSRSDLRRVSESASDVSRTDSLDEEAQRGIEGSESRVRLLDASGRQCPNNLQDQIPALRSFDLPLHPLILSDFSKRDGRITGH